MSRHHWIWREGEVGILHRNDLSHVQTPFGCEVSLWQGFQNHHQHHYRHHPSDVKVLRQKKKPDNRQENVTQQGLVRLVVQNTEELISRPLEGLLKIRLLFQDGMRSLEFRNQLAALNQSLLSCLTHTIQLLLLNGHSSRICSETGLMYLSSNKYMRPVSEQILLEGPLRSGGSLCMFVGRTKVTG